ncbi:MAG: WG repeat-containing protein [Prevotella sp.]|nr:WG repeat-containing protein [Prevotella sp.]
MKTLSKKIMLMMSLFLASVAFTACSSSDDDGGSNGDNIGSNNTQEATTLLWPAYSAPFDSWGYINENGEMVIAPQFKKASSFYFIDDIATFVSLDTVEELVWSSLDKNGIAAVVETADGKICLIDTNGNIKKTSTSVTDIAPPTDLSYLWQSEFQNLPIVRKDGLAGLVDSNLEYILQPIYDAISMPTEEGYIICVKDGMIGCINTKGETVLDFKYRHWQPSLGNCFYIPIEGLIDVIGNNGKYGYINTKGEVVIDFKFDYAESFESGVAPVRINNKWGLIDKNGEFVVEPQYEEIKHINGTNRLCFRVSETLWYPPYQTYYYGVIDNTGKEILPAIYSYIPCYRNYNSELVVVEKGDKYGCVDLNGNTVIDFKYQSINAYEDYFEVYSGNGTHQCIDRAGNVITPQTTLEENEFIVFKNEDRDFYLYYKDDNNGKTFRYVKSGKTVYSWTEKD